MSVQSTDTTVVSTVKSDLTWLASHITLLLVVAALIGASIYGIDVLIAKRDAAQEQKYEAILTTQVEQTKSLQQQLANDIAANSKRDSQYQQTIATLSQTILQRDAQAKQQQTVDSSLDSQSAAQRLAAQTNSNPIPVSNNSLILDIPTARVVVSDLDEFAATKADLADTQKQLINQTNLTTDAQQNAADAQKVIAAQVVQLGDATNVCKAQIADITAKARKSKFKWFLGGAATVLGFLIAHGI